MLILTLERERQRGNIGLCPGEVSPIFWPGARGEGVLGMEKVLVITATVEAILPWVLVVVEVLKGVAE